MRSRNWIVALVLVVAVVAVATLAGHSKPSDTTGKRPVVAFGSRVGHTPSSATLRFTNGWSASSGAYSIAVYAGAQSTRARNGLLVIRRGRTGKEHLRSVVLPGAGAVTLLRPAPVQNETAAYNATLRFVTASGGTGTLNVADGKVSLQH
jgi:hypothetical protein